MAWHRPASSTPIGQDSVECISPAMQPVYTLADRLASTDLTILITGESGTGKEVLARRIYARSLRKSSALVKVSTSTIPDNLIESELFGYQRGAFTGAEQDKKGRVEGADKGTLLLDEVDLLSAPAQTKLLQVLQDGQFMPLGSNSVVSVNVRILALASRDLSQAVVTGEFREDLFHRLNVAPIRIPPLRERAKDISLLADFFVQRYAREFRLPPVQFQENDYEALRRYSWPGNVRELENLIKNLVLLGNVSAAFSKLEAAGMRTKRQRNSNLSLIQIRKRTEREVERRVIAAVLDRNHWDRTKTAKALRISYRSLLYKIQKLKLKENDEENKSCGDEI